MWSVMLRRQTLAQLKRLRLRLASLAGQTIPSPCTCQVPYSSPHIDSWASLVIACLAQYMLDAT